MFGSIVQRNAERCPVGRGIVVPGKASVPVDPLGHGDGGGPLWRCEARVMGPGGRAETRRRAADRRPSAPSRVRRALAGAPGRSERRRTWNHPSPEPAPTSLFGRRGSTTDTPPRDPRGVHRHSPRASPREPHILGGGPPPTVKPSRGSTGNEEGAGRRGGRGGGQEGGGQTRV